jgi:ribonuclease HI
MVKEIIVYSDGSSSKKNNVRYGGVGVYFNDYESYNVSMAMQGEIMTNSRTELLACLVALEQCVDIIKKNKIKSCNVLLYTDSKYVINSSTTWIDNWIANDWKRKVGKNYCDIAHVDVIKKIYELTKKLNVSFHHYHSHTKEPPKNDINWIHWNGNNNADELAGKPTKLMMKTMSK